MSSALKPMISQNTETLPDMKPSSAAGGAVKAAFA
jgi:hypothetical protein